MLDCEKSAKIVPKPPSPRPTSSPEEILNTAGKPCVEMHVNAFRCVQKHSNVLQLDARDHMNSKAQCWSLAGFCVCVVSNGPPQEKTLQGVTTDRHGSETLFRS